MIPYRPAFCRVKSSSQCVCSILNDIEDVFHYAMAVVRGLHEAVGVDRV